MTCVRYTRPLLVLTSLLVAIPLRTSQASANELLWAAANVGRPAARLNWDADLGTVYRDGKVILGGDRERVGRDLGEISLLLSEVDAEIYNDNGGDLSPIGLTKLAYFEETAGILDAQAVVAYSAESPRAAPVVVVAVRGTESFQDWLTDFSVVRVNMKGDTYHLGFVKYADSLYGSIRSVVAPYCGDGKTRLWVTGHSLGGVAAHIIALWLSRDGCFVNGVMSFGAPRGGLQASYGNSYEAAEAQHLDDNTHRWEHEVDPVTCVPSGSLWAQVGVRHVIYGGAPTGDDDGSLQPIMTGTSLFEHADAASSLCSDWRLPTLLDDVANVGSRSSKAHRIALTYRAAMRQAYGDLESVGW